LWAYRPVLEDWLNQIAADPALSESIAWNDFCWEPIATSVSSIPPACSLNDTRHRVSLDSIVESDSEGDE
jgi:hypothetical protein